MTQKDYYKTLGVARNATKEEIKKAYRELAHKYHPDKGGNAEQFKEINEAYHILNDEGKRAQYDQFGQVFEGGSGGPGQGGFQWPGGFRFDFGGRNAESGSGEFDFSDVFEDLFGMASGGGRTKSANRRGKDVSVDIELSFEEAILGVKKDLELLKLSRCSRCGGTSAEKGSKMLECRVCGGRGHVQKTQKTFLGAFTQVAVCDECGGAGKKPEKPCTQCGGRGVEHRNEQIEIFIPKSVREGEVLKISGKGEASGHGGAPGDLYMRIHVMAHRQFRRQGDDIIMSLPISLSQAIAGDAVDIAALDGTLKLKIPEGTQAGDILSIRGRGAYAASGYGRGNLLIEMKVEIPKKMTRRLKDIVRELKEEGW